MAGKLRVAAPEDVYILRNSDPFAHQCVDDGKSHFIRGAVEGFGELFFFQQHFCDLSAVPEIGAAIAGDAVKSARHAIFCRQLGKEFSEIMFRVGTAGDFSETFVFEVFHHRGQSLLAPEDLDVVDGCSGDLCSHAQCRGSVGKNLLELLHALFFTETQRPDGDACRKIYQFLQKLKFCRIGQIHKKLDQKIVVPFSQFIFQLFEVLHVAVAADIAHDTENDPVFLITQS